MDAGPGPPFAWGNIASKVIIVVALGYAIFVVAFCPCKQLLSCHLAFFYTAIAIALVVAIFWNGLRMW